MIRPTWFLSMLYPAALMLVFFGFQIPRAQAATIYEQLTDDSGEIALDHTSGGAEIATFTLAASTTITASSTIQLSLRTYTLSTGGPINIHVSSSTCATGPTFMTFQVSMPAADGIYHTRTDEINSGYGKSLIPATYIVCGDSFSIFNDVRTQADAADLNFFGFVSNDASSTVFDTTTRIIVTDPYHYETIATSSTTAIGATGYINASDFEDGMYLQIKYLQQSSAQAAVGNVDLLSTTIDVPIAEDGSFSVSTTTSILRPGVYTANWSIRAPSFANTALNFLGFGQFANFGVKVSTTTTFIADHLTAFDSLVASTTESIEAYLASSTVSLASCTDWTHLNFIDCLNLLFVPQTALIQEALNNFKNGFLTYFPWGYVTRLVVIFSGNSESDLPAFSVPVQISPTESLTVNYDMQDMIAGGAAALDSTTLDIPSAEGKTAREIVEPFLRLFLALSVLFIIVRDLLAFQSHGQHVRNSKLS